MSDESDDLRPWLKAYLTPLLPTEWAITDSMTMPDRIMVPTVTLTHIRISPYTPLPQSENLVNDVVIRVADPHNEFAVAETSLDEEVLALIHALKRSNRLRWSSAEKVQIDKTAYYGWDITVQVVTTNKNGITP